MSTKKKDLKIKTLDLPKSLKDLDYKIANTRGSIKSLKEKLGLVKQPELRSRKPGGRDPVQHANSLYKKWLVSEDPVEKRLVKKELNYMMKKYDLVNPVKFDNQTKQGTTHYIFSRKDWERKKKKKKK